MVPSLLRLLDVVLDCDLSMAEHVDSIVRSYFYQLRQLRFLLLSLSEGTARMRVHEFVASRVDCSNSCCTVPRNRPPKDCRQS